MAMPMPEISDLTRFHRDYRPGLMAFFLRRVRNHAEAEDLTQEVFIRIAQGGGAAMKSAEAYIFQVAANLLRDRVRRNKVRDQYLAELKPGLDEENELLDPQRIVAGREALERLSEGLRDLPERTRLIFLLFRYENLDYKTIADSLGISTSAVEKHVYRAMAKLITCTEGEYDNR